MAEAYLSLGTNMGDRRHNVEQAVKALTTTPGIKIIRQSSVYETEPWGLTDQPEFWNIVMQIETELPALELLKQCQQIENDLGRKRFVRWGPRTIDIDILLYDNIISDSLELTIPHPRMEERSFVLVPLQEIAPHLRLPSGRMIAEVAGGGQVRRLESFGRHP